MPTPTTYLIEPKNGRLYVSCLHSIPVITLFDIVDTQEQADKAVEDHKAGLHPTQYPNQEKKD